MTDRLILTLAILGGTGKLGGALALRWARAGYHVILGSREEAKARQAAGEANARLGSESVAAATNADAAGRCDIAVLTVPYAAQPSTLEAVRQHLQGKLLVCTTVPLDPKQAGVAHFPQAGSAAQEAQAALGREVPVAAAFHHVSFEHLREEGSVACDVLVCSDSDGARAQTVALAEAAGLRAWQAGPLSNAGVLEGLTSILISINRRHKVHGAGILITGDPASGERRPA